MSQLKLVGKKILNHFPLTSTTEENIYGVWVVVVLVWWLFVFLFFIFFFYIEKMKINVLFSNFQFTMDGLGKADSLGKKSARFGAQLCRGARAHPRAHSHGLWGAGTDNQVPITRPSPSGLGDAGSTGACQGEQRCSSPALTCSISSK